jgi:hypothetical protein
MARYKKGRRWKYIPFQSPGAPSGVPMIKSNVPLRDLPKLAPRFFPISKWTQKKVRIKKSSKGFWLWKFDRGKK